MTPDGESSGGLVEAVASERERLARRLHDDAVQTISAAGLRLSLLRSTLAAPVEELDELEEAIALTASQLRQLLQALRRPPLASAGVVACLRELVTLGGVGANASVIDDLDREPPPSLGLALLWIGDELVRAFHRSGGYGAVVLRLHSSTAGFQLEAVAAHQGGPLVVVDEVQRLAAMVGASVTLDEATPGRSRVVVTAPSPPG